MKKAFLIRNTAICLCALPLTAFAEIHLSGFATVGMGKTLDKKESLYGYDDTVDFKQNSLFAIQASATLDDGVGVTAQIISRGTDDWDPDFEWAFLSYDVSDNWRLLFGRQRAPQKLYSDYVDVGYAYHWISPPSGLYSPSFDSFDGVGSIYNSTLGSFDSTFHMMFGRTSDNPFGDAVREIDISDYIIGTYSLTDGVYTFRVGVAQRDVFVDIPEVNDSLAGGLALVGSGLAEFFPPAAAIDYKDLGDSLIIDDNTTFYTAAFKADYDSGFIIAEWEVNDYGDNFLGETENWYVSGGLKSGDFVYHLTYGVNETEVDNLNRYDPVSALLNFPLPEALAIPLTGIVGGSNQTLQSRIADEDYITIGVRWDFHDSAALKAEYTKFSDDFINPYDPTDMDADADLVRVALSTIF